MGGRRGGQEGGGGVCSMGGEEGWAVWGEEGCAV